MAENPFAAAMAAPAKKAAAKKTAAPAKEKTVATKTVTEAAAPQEEPVDMSNAFAFLMAQVGGVIEITDEDLAAPTPAFRPYVMPANGELIPLEITSAKLGTWDVKGVVLEPDRFPIMSQTVTMPRFELELRHLSTAYGDRFNDYLLGVTVTPVYIAKSDGSGAFKKTSGNRLLAATGVMTTGQKLQIAARTPEALTEELAAMAEQMVGKYVIAKVRHRVVANQTVIPKKNPDGSFVYNEDGSVVKEYKDNPRTYDNLQDDVYPVPGRIIVIDDEIEAEITWETITRIVKKPIAIGTQVEAVGTEDGKKYTVYHNGEGWSTNAPGGALAKGSEIFSQSA